MCLHKLKQDDMQHSLRQTAHPVAECGDSSQRVLQSACSTISIVQASLKACIKAIRSVVLYNCLYNCAYIQLMVMYEVYAYMGDMHSPESLACCAHCHHTIQQHT